MNKKIKDKINPSHYQGSIQTIDCIQSQLNDDEFKGYLKGNVFKYVARCTRKETSYQGDNQGELTDVLKARWYIEKLINYLENKNKKKGS